MDIKEYILEIKSKRLKRVDLINYKLEEIPSEIFSFIWIEELYFGGFLDYHKYAFVDGGPCKLTYLPREINHLINLKTISLCGGLFGSPKCEISDFSILGEINSLEELHLNATELNDINFLRQLPNLKKLQISHTEVLDYSPISEFKSLISLTLGDNNLSTIDFLSTTKNLEAISLTTNNLTSLNPIAKNRNLKRICVCNNDTIDLKDINNYYPNLEHLCIGDKQTIDLVLPLKKLKEIRLKGLSNKTIEKFKNHSQLEECIFTEINDEEINVSSLLHVKELELSGTFSEISGLENLSNLRSLTVSSIKLNSIDIPSKLMTLVITDCEYSDLNKINNLNQLEKLFISSTKIESLKALSNATNLKELDIQFNSIKTLKPIVELIANGLEVEFAHTEIPFEVLELYEEEKFQELIEYYKFQ